jgi:hypothetical protein
MRKKTRFLIVAQMLISLGLLSLSVTTGSLHGVKACYYCAWNNQYQVYECKVYEGPGYSGCEAQGLDCHGTGTCGL